MKNIANFLKEVISELKKVVWPKREQTIKLTLVVIAVSVAVAAFVGIIDFILSKGLAALVGVR